MKDYKKILKLFFSMLTISAFTFGGGFVIIGMMKKKFCEQLHWVNDEVVLDMTAIAQSAPGALAVNNAIIFGYKIAGTAGAFVSILATVIPPITIISIICIFYQAFSNNLLIQTALQVMRAGVGAVIVDVVIDLSAHVFKSKNFFHILFMTIAFIASWIFHISAITIILISVILGVYRAILDRKEHKK